MRKLVNTLIGAACLVSVFTGCSEETIPLYSGVKAGLFIQEVRTTDGYGNPTSYNDSTSFSFASYDPKVTTLTARFYVRTMGEVVDYDRPFKMEILENNGVEGEDFDLETDGFVIKANESTARVAVRLHRTPKLLKETVRIKLGLVPNEHFELPIDQYKNSSSWSADGSMNSATSFIIKVNERYSQPRYWGLFGEDYWGKFTPNKLLELNKVMGWTMNDWSNAGFTGAKIVYGRLEFAAKTFQKHLQKMADAGTPVLDEDGSYMQLANDYAVDYSRYME